MLTRCYLQRQMLREQKRKLLLEFLRDEIWSSAPVLTQVLGLTLSATYKTLNSFEKAGLIKSLFVQELNFKVWGITNAGLFESWDAEKNMIKRTPFEPSKFKPIQARHELYLQQARIQALENNWSDWRLGKHLMNVEKRPDAIARDPNGRVVHIEFEQVVKCKSRLEKIFSVYLQKIKRGELDYVAYVCPTELFAKRLVKLFNSIKEIPVAGTRVPITDKHRAKFIVTDLSRWPNLQLNITPTPKQN